MKGLALSDDDRLRGEIIERLMCDLAVNLDAVEGGAARFANELAALKPLADDGLLTIAGARITITERGRPYVRIAAAAFDAYLKTRPETAFGGGVSGIKAAKQKPRIALSSPYPETKADPGHAAPAGVTLIGAVSS